MRASSRILNRNFLRPPTSTSLEKWAAILPFKSGAKMYKGSSLEMGGGKKAPSDPLTWLQGVSVRQENDL